MNPAPSSEPLPNPRHEAFAREIASGRNATQAYQNVYGTENRRVASTGGSRLLRRKGIIAHIQALQKAGAASVALTLQEIHDFLTRVVRTPAGQLTPSSDLCIRVKVTRDGHTDLWMPNKLACLRLSAKLQGFLDKPPESEPPPSDLTPIITEEQRLAIITLRNDALEAIKKKESAESIATPQNPPVPPDPQVAEKRPVEEQGRAEHKPSPQAPIVRTGSPVQSPPPAPSANTGHLAWAAYPSTANSASPNWPMRPPSNLVPRHQYPTSFSRITPDSASEIVII